jgi:hypothetical protein
MVRVGGFEPPVSCFQGRRGRPDSPTPCCELAARWSSRQDSNLHQSAFVVRCSSIEPREELVCLAGGVTALTSHLGAQKESHFIVRSLGGERHLPGKLSLPWTASNARTL